jgi:hypothetical protein
VTPNALQLLGSDVDPVPKGRQVAGPLFGPGPHHPLELDAIVTVGAVLRRNRVKGRCVIGGNPGMAVHARREQPHVLFVPERILRGE